MVKEPTTIGGYIDDLFITNIPDKVSTLVVHGYDYDSDHFTIEVLLDWTKDKLHTPSRLVYDLAKANYHNLREDLAKAEHTYLNDDTFDINQKWETWYGIIHCTWGATELSVLN